MAVPNSGINTLGLYGPFAGGLGTGGLNGSYYNPLGSNALLTSYGGLNNGSYGGLGGGAYGGLGGGALGGGASLASGIQALAQGAQELVSAFSKIKDAGGLREAMQAPAGSAWENSGAESAIV